jgi:hypothetical protein
MTDPTTRPAEALLTPIREHASFWLDGDCDYSCRCGYKLVLKSEWKGGNADWMVVQEKWVTHIEGVLAPKLNALVGAARLEEINLVRDRAANGWDDDVDRYLNARAEELTALRAALAGTGRGI